jgi:hypothetical protein
MPPGWIMHRPAGSLPNRGGRGRRITATPIEFYKNLITVEIGNEGISVGKLNGSGAGMLQVGPSGLGNTWYPVSISVGTGTGLANISNDNSQCILYCGPLAISQYYLTTIQPGTGQAGTLPATLTRGQYVFAEWSGGVANDSLLLNVGGQQDALNLSRF